jgi:putative DNA primase/helicase
MMTHDAMFTPLPEAPRGTTATTAAPRAKAAADWLPELPAPEEPPAVPRHPKHGTPSATWAYRDAEGRPLFVVARFDPPDGKEVMPLTFGTLRGRRGWQWKAPPTPSPLYGLPDLAARPAAPVLVVEGEKTADAAALLFPEHVAVTWQGGSNAAGRADWTPLAGRRVTVWPDHDDGRPQGCRRSRGGL